MSKPNPRRGAKSSSRKVARDTENDESTDRTTSRSAVAAAGPSRAAADKDPKDETATDDKKDAKTPDDAATTPAVPKPQSAGATIRDAGQKLLSLTMKQEWTSIDTVLKQLEKIVAAGGGETHTAPLAGVMDPVTKNSYTFFSRFFFFNLAACPFKRKHFILEWYYIFCHNWVKVNFLPIFHRICLACRTHLFQGKFECTLDEIIDHLVVLRIK